MSRLWHIVGLLALVGALTVAAGAGSPAAAGGPEPPRSRGREAPGKGTRPRDAAADKAQNGEPSLARVLQDAREAMGYRELSRKVGSILVEGDAHLYGLDQTFGLAFTPGGEFARVVDGKLGEGVGFDGKTGWSTDWYGTVHSVELEDLEVQQAIYWTLAGRWMAADSPFDMSVQEKEGDRQSLVLRLDVRGGRLECRLVLDRATWMPSELYYHLGTELGVVAFREFDDRLGFSFPRRWTHTSRGLTESFQVRKIEEAPSETRVRYRVPSPGKATADFDPAGPRRPTSRRTPEGHFLVRPRIDGQPVGWFLLDSGSSVSIITPSAAREAGLPALGTYTATGVGTPVQTVFRRANRLELGRWGMANPVFVQLDLSALSKRLGMEIAGICGYEVFSRAVVVIDPVGSRVELHDPAEYKLPEGRWQDLHLNSKLPCVSCDFEGNRRELFMLDCGSTETVAFDAPAVRRLGLLEGRKTDPIRTTGVGGTVEDRSGKLDWFAIGGRRFEDLRVRFRSPVKGAYSTHYVAGHVGLGVLEPFQIVFNYPANKIALLRVDAGST